MSKSSLTIQESRLKRVIWISTALILLSWLATYFLLKDIDSDERGTLGDMFGSINALFSGLALAGIIFSILLQRLELGYQREELRETRKEFIAQNDTLRKQRFENTFFNLIRLYQDTVENLVISQNGFDYAKSKCLERLYATLSAECERELNKINPSKAITAKMKYINLQPDETRDLLITSYSIYYVKNGSKAAHWLRILKNIISFIETSPLLENASEKQFYSSIFIDQLSTPELKLIYYHTYSGYKEPCLSDYIKKYDFLRNFDESGLIDNTHTIIKTSQSS